MFYICSTIALASPANGESIKNLAMVNPFCFGNYLANANWFLWWLWICL